MMTPRQAVDFLNQLLLLDYDGIAEIFTTRIPVPETFLNVPVVPGEVEGVSVYGALGIINAMYDGQIVMVHQRSDALCTPKLFCLLEDLSKDAQATL
jgi:hypothetical protein